MFQGILTTLSQSHGKYKYDYATVPFLAEVFKVPFDYDLSFSGVLILIYSKHTLDLYQAT